MLGYVSTPVVCLNHGLYNADTGVNLLEGGSISEVEHKRDFHCPECGKDAPRWDRESCPNCGEKRLQAGAEILFD